jgi:ferredoxin--NADP+ reductase
MNHETVTEVEHYTDRLFRFKTTRDRGFRFNSGEFAMIGLNSEKYNKQIFRAYSICSTPYDDFLEFFSIKVPDGPLTSQLQHIKVGDDILVKPKVTGSLVVDYATPKQNLVMLATGTGVAPFMSIVRDFHSYERFEKLYLFRTVREVAELAYQDELLALEQDMPFTYVDTVTQGRYIREGRFWDHLEKYLPGGLNKERDAVMVCGSPELNRHCRSTFTEQGWQEGNTGEMGDFLLERAFAG